MSTLTWVTEKELEWEVKKTKETNFIGRKTWKFYSGSEKKKKREMLAATKVKIPPKKMLLSTLFF